MKKISLIGCRLRGDGNIDIPTKKLKECEIIEDELFELVGYYSDAWSGKKVIVHEFRDEDYQKAIPIEKVNLWTLIYHFDTAIIPVRIIGGGVFVFFILPVIIHKLIHRK